MTFMLFYCGLAPLLSCIFLIANVAEAGYQINKIVKKKLNQLKYEIYIGTKAYKQVIKENK